AAASAAGLRQTRRSPSGCGLITNSARIGVGGAGGRKDLDPEDQALERRDAASGRENANGQVADNCRRVGRRCVDRVAKLGTEYGEGDRSEERRVGKEWSG